MTEAVTEETDFNRSHFKVAFAKGCRTTCRRSAVPVRNHTVLSLSFKQPDQMSRDQDQFE